MKTILIIEDERPLLTALSSKLSNAGFSILQATDGETGLSTALEKHPDLILLDIVLPKMDGLTMLDMLRRDDWGKTAPIIVLTNLSDAARFEESMRKNVFDYLIKTDWKIEDVVIKVKEKLQLHDA